MPKSGLLAGEGREEGDLVHALNSGLELEFFDRNKFRADTLGLSKEVKLAHLQRHIDALVTLATTKGIQLDVDLFKERRLSSSPKVGVLNEEGHRSPFAANSWAAVVEQEDRNPSNVLLKVPLAASPAIPEGTVAIGSSKIPVTFSAAGITVPAVVMGGPVVATGGTAIGHLAGGSQGLEGSPSLNLNPKPTSKSHHSTSFTSSLSCPTFSPPNTSILGQHCSNSNTKVCDQVKMVEGKLPPLCFSQDVDPKSTLARAPITSLTSPFPPFSSNSNPSLLSPNLSHTPLLLFGDNPNESQPSSSTPIGQPLTGQISLDFGQSKPLTGQPNPLTGPMPGHPPPVLSTGQASIQSGHPTAKSWSSLLQHNHQRLSLNFVPPSHNDQGFLSLGMGTSKEGEERWKTTIIGYSVGKRIPFKLVKQKAMAIWGKEGLNEVRVNKEGFYFFSFLDKNGMDYVLRKAPWSFFGQFFHLKPWTRLFDFHKEEFKSIPIWVKFFGIPTAYWTGSGLSAIASKIGVPLYADEVTSTATILEFARICVDMKVEGDFPLSFTVQTEHKEDFEVRVEYGWKPSLSRPKASNTPPIAVSACSTVKHTILWASTAPLVSPVVLPVKKATPTSTTTNGSEEGEIIEEVDELGAEESTCLVGTAVGNPGGSTEPRGTEECGTDEGHVTSPRDESLEVKISSEEEGDWTPIPWGKKRIIVDEFDKRRVRKSKGKGKKGSRFT